jgi:DNA-binding PadR family transcriptional regulator
MYGQQIRKVIETHHDLFADFIKKPTIYYQLDRLAADGYLEIRHEMVEAPGTGYANAELAPRERGIYYLTDAGRQHFFALLRESMETYTPGMSDIDAYLFFLHHLPTSEAVRLLGERYRLVAAAIVRLIVINLLFTLAFTAMEAVFPLFTQCVYCWAAGCRKPFRLRRRWRAVLAWRGARPKIRAQWRNGTDCGHELQ